MRWADYSAGRPSAAALKAAGFGGALRYVAYGRASKLLVASEVQDFQRNGFGLATVIEADTNDAWGTETDDDFERGQRFGRDGLAALAALGVAPEVTLFAAADSHATAGQLDDVDRFARGFASVVAPVRPAGMYGFSEVMNETRDVPGLSAWWQCGSRPEKTGTTWVNLWQRNDGTTTVSGITCDINEQYHPLPAIGWGGSSTGGASAPAASAPAERVIPMEDCMKDLPAGERMFVRLFCAGRPHFFWWEINDNKPDGTPHQGIIDDIAYIRDTPDSADADYGPVGQPGYPDLRGWVFHKDRSGPIKFADDVAWIRLIVSCDGESSMAVG